jgi:hypothetical protein
MISEADDSVGLRGKGVRRVAGRKALGFQFLFLPLNRSLSAFIPYRAAKTVG